MPDPAASWLVLESYSKPAPLRAAKGQVPHAPLLTVSDLATMLKLKPATVRRMAAQGRVGYHRLGKELRFRDTDVERLLEATRREPRAGVRG